MHDAARQWVWKSLAGLWEMPRTVVELGSHDLNGSVRDLFEGSHYTGVDLIAGKGVDVVCDAVSYRHPAPVDLVLCLEVLEHSPWGSEIISTAHSLLRDGGCLILTAAGEGRAPHSGIDGAELRPGEHYENISESALADWLEQAGFARVAIDILDTDIRAVAWK